jgi:hypothetical protein
MNWGKKIIVVYIVFVTGIMLMVYKASRQNIDLVTTDYYEQELKYQQRIDETAAANSLSRPVKCEVNNNSISILFPEEMNEQQVDANIWLYYPADKSKDIHQKLTTINGKLSMPIPVVNKGMHELKLSWVAGKKKYYSQQKLFIQ